jgi:hypothetical protein
MRAQQVLVAEISDLLCCPMRTVPLREGLFEGTTQFFLERGEVVWRGPSPRVLFSTTVSGALKEEHSVAGSE